MAPSLGGGAVPSLSAEDLARAVPGLTNEYEIVTHLLRHIPSVNITYEDISALTAAIAHAIEAGAQGIVVTQGTDTLEETAFALDLLTPAGVPIVVTGAMRHAAALSADGPANIASAVRVAADPAAAGLGVLVVLNDEIHAAQFVQKMHTHKPSAFSSPLAGPLGWVMEGKVHIRLRPATPAPNLTYGAGRPLVPLITCTLGMEAREIAAFTYCNPQGAVVAAMGCGHLPEVIVPELETLAGKVPVVLASRVGTGEMCRNTYGYAGGEIDLLKRGLIPAGSLNPLKARVLLSILLSNGADHAWVTSTFSGL